MSLPSCEVIYELGVKDVCPCCMSWKHWKLEHEKLDDERKALFTALINEHAKLKTNVAELFEWFESKTSFLAITFDSEEYEEKKKGLLWKR